MKKNKLGRSEIEVSALCFGSLTFSPLQKNLTAQRAAELIYYAYQRGVNFLDSADLYNNYPAIKAALKLIGRPNYVIASKSYAYDQKGALASVQKALKQLETDYIDIWLMHEQESSHTMRGHEEALNTYLKLKERGVLRAVGISTHFSAAVTAALNYPGIDVIHPIYNIAGIGIQDGSAQQMKQKIAEAKAAGVGIYAMKVFGGGHLLKSRRAALDHVVSTQLFDSYAIGMQSEAEIDYNCAALNQTLTDALCRAASLQDKQLMIHDWCTRCLSCLKHCQFSALSYDIQDDKIVIDYQKCVKCGYCSQYCPEFCIKVV